MNYNLSKVDWFEWNDVKCTQYGMHVLTQPSFIRPPERVEHIVVPGRSGSLTYTEGRDIFDDITLVAGCVVDRVYTSDYGDTGVINPIDGWLSGQGTVKFANRADGVYKGRVANQISFDKILRGNPHHGFQVQFVCNPFLYLDSGTYRSYYTSSPITLNNPGNIAAAPEIQITGSGTGTIMCGSSTMMIVGQGLSGVNSLTLDCDAKVVYSGIPNSPLDPMRLAGTRATGEWLTIPTGTSYLSFSGGITSVTIKPNWRRI